jgi:glycosyltransferase involved in cell wall biosynthesis
VVITGDVIGDRMAGPAIRAWHIASALAASHQVELVTSGACTHSAATGFGLRQVTTADVAALVPDTDIWVVQGSVLNDFPVIARSSAVIVVDLYDPYHLENLELSRELEPPDRITQVHNATTVLNLSMVRGDFFLTASVKQRDFWLGALAALGRVNPATYDADPSLAHLVAVVPFGIDDAPPQRSASALRGVVPGIGPQDAVLLWAGGLYNWFDPQTLVRAIDQVRRRRDDVRLVFMGGQHPNPDVPAMRVALETRQLADDLDLTGRWVFFNDGWVPYDQRANFLAEADIGVSTHLDHIETSYSFRTRILDYLWAGLPIIATDGDVFGELIRELGLGAAVPPGDADALAAAVLELLDDDARRGAAASAASRAATEYRWSRALQPLLNFCADAHRAADSTDELIQLNLTRPLQPLTTARLPSGLHGQVALARDYLRTGGIRLLVKRVTSRLAKVLRRG